MVQARPKVGDKAGGDGSAAGAGNRFRGAADRSHGEIVYWRKAGTAGLRLQCRGARRRWPAARRGSARKSQGYSQRGGGGAHNRAQVLYYVGENLSQRAEEIAGRLAAVVGKEQAGAEVRQGIERIFSYAAWADKYDGGVHNPPFRNIALAMHEPVGTVGIVCPADVPLLGFLSLVMPAIAMGNTVIAIPSETYPLIIGDLYQVFETSDIPGGVINMVSGRSDELMKVLAEHDDIDAIWSFVGEASGAAAKLLSVGNLKQVFSNEGRAIDWFNMEQGEGRWFLHHATQVKNIWVPYGE